MTIILFAFVIFLGFLEYIIIFDVILSWLSLLGVRFRPRFVSDILDPIYEKVRHYIPTRFGAFDFTPIVVILLLILVRSLILSAFPEVGLQLSQLQSR